MKLEKIMINNAITVSPNDTIATAYKIMMENQVNGTPVVDGENNLQGIIVRADIYRFLIDPGHYDSCPVDWVMSKSVVSAKKDENILEVAKRIRENDIIAIPVVDDKNKVIGIISIEDILDFFISHFSN